MRIQSKAKNRKRLSPAVLQEIAIVIERLAIRHDVSKSFVISTLLADSLKIATQERYDDQSKTTRETKTKSKSHESSHRTNRTRTSGERIQANS